jgi:L-lactate dehydrogenase complex protein LldG
MAGTPMSSREAILGRIRKSLHRTADGPAVVTPSIRLRPANTDLTTSIELFTLALEKLGGTVYLAQSPADAREHVLTLVGDRSYFCVHSTLLEECGLQQTVTPAEHRRSCAQVDVGVTGASYGLAETGTLVMLASSGEGRLPSLLPPMHIALLTKDRLLANLDELLTVMPNPAETTSSMVLITGPSRTGDIEQILVRGVHGPGDISVVIL